MREAVERAWPAVDELSSDPGTEVWAGDLVGGTGRRGPAVRMQPARSVDDVLALAIDLCIGVGAFLVSSTGDVRVVLSDAMPPEDGERRLAALGRSCTTHPAADGHELFWNAEVSTEVDSVERSLACVVVPVWSGDVRRGLLGVADTWLPEPDPDQRAGLLHLADLLAEHMAEPGGPPTGRAEGPRAAEAVGPPPEVRPPAARPLAAPGPESLALGVLHHLPDPVLVISGDGTMVLANLAFAGLVGLTVEQLTGKDVSAVLSEGEPSRAASTDTTADLLHLLEPGGPPLRLTALRAVGGVLPVDVSGTRLPATLPGDCSVLVVRPVVPAALHGLDVVVDDLVEGLDDGVLCLDASGMVVLANRSANVIHGLPEHRSLVGSPLPMVSALRTEDGQVLAHDHHPGLRALRDGAPVVAHLTLGDDQEGMRHVTVSARPFPVAGSGGALVVFHDTTAEWMEQQRLTHYALHDPLTNLANRYLLLEELRRMLQGLGRRGGSVALVFLDLDNFKQINDRYGHDVGDEVLTAVARRLKGAVRVDDVVARLGGDEFVIAHASGELLVDGDMVVSRIRKVLSAPFRVRGDAFDVGASIGWVSTDTGDIGPDALLAKADRAMYRHKRDRAVSRHSGD